MNDTKTKMPVEVPESVKEDLKSIIEEGAKALDFKKFTSEIAEFDKKHAERRSKLQNGSRRRTRGGTI